MDENKFKLSLTPGSQAWLWLVSRVNWLLVCFSLRQKRKFWGIVYDSVSKQPLDPALLTLAYTDGTSAQTCITDMEGNYGFLAHAGKFKILAKKTNYTFPSRLVLGNTDGIYDSLYHGEFFTLDDYEVVAPNIPMDPQNFDWNQKAKLEFTRRYALSEYVFKVIAGLFFWSCFILLCVSVWVIALHPWAGWPNPRQFFYLYIGTVFYLLMFLLAVFMSEVRLWGKIIYKGFDNPHLAVELFRPELPGVVFGTSQVEENGLFLLRAGPGKYKLVIKQKAPDRETVVLGSVPVTIGPEKVVNQAIKLIDLTPKFTVL